MIVRLNQQQPRCLTPADCLGFVEALFCPSSEQLCASHDRSPDRPRVNVSEIVAKVRGILLPRATDHASRWSSKARTIEAGGWQDRWSPYLGGVGAGAAVGDGGKSKTSIVGLSSDRARRAGPASRS